MVFITPTEITPGSTGSWQDADVSAYIPDTATGVALHIVNNSGGTRTIGWRKNGSTDDRRTDNQATDTHFWCAIGVDANRVLELYIESTDQEIFIVGYFESEAVFFDNGVDKTPASASSWQDADISGDTGADTAIGAIFETVGSGYYSGLRNNGSTDARTPVASRHHGRIIGVDGSEICEIYSGSTSNEKFYLVGYITSGATFNTNATSMYSFVFTDRGVWKDMSALAAGAIGAFIEVYGSNSLYALRENGSAEDIYEKTSGACHGIVEADASRIIEGKVEYETTIFYLQGYPTLISSTSIKSWNGLAKASLKSINGVGLSDIKSINGLV